MPIKFSDHAIKQLRRREITDEITIQVVKKPDEIILSYRDRKLRRSHINDKILEVVTKTEGSLITIITAYYLEE
jgi:hypothetical protein